MHFGYRGCFEDHQKDYAEDHKCTVMATSVDLFFFITLFATNTYVKNSTTTVTHMYVVYVTSSKVHNQDLAMRL